MKKTITLIAMMFAMVLAMANPVSQDEARRVAQTWMQAQGMKNPAALQDITSQTPFTEFYVFAAPDGGFVLVSGDDCVQPVLAYSLTTRFVAEGMPVNVRGFLEGYDKEIKWIKSHQRQNGLSVATSRNYVPVRPAMWRELLGGVAPEPALTVVSPLMTTTWNQSPYYNALCPDDNSGAGPAVTGCVATATAQVMKYHNHPTTGYGSHTYSTTEEGQYGTYTYNNVTANFGATTYQWSQMPNALNSSSTTAQVNAVATLMFHVGVADEMGYSPEESGAQNYNVYGSIMPSSQTSLMKYFKYRSDMIVLRRGDESDDAYAARLRAELDQSRPILYSGADYVGGHSFVLDGYNSSGYFHVNWGWGGYQDGYYTVGALNPGEGGTGGNATYTFNLRNAALIGIRPNTSWSTTGTTTVTVTTQNAPSGCSAAAYNSSTEVQSSSYGFGDTVMILASAAEGYRFDSWTDGSKQNPREIIANGGSYSFTATFAAIGSDTVSYCPSNVAYSAYGFSGIPFGVKLPASALNSSSYLTAVIFYAYEAGTYDITVYTGSNHSTQAATATHTVYDNDANGWQTVQLATPVDATSDIWIMINCSDASYPAAFTSYSGVPSSFVIGNNFSESGDNFYGSFMIKGIFGSGVSAGCDAIAQFPYTEDFEDIESLGCWHLLDNDGDGYGWVYYGGTDSLYGHNSNYCLGSASWYNVALTPDNWLFMPAMQLPAGQQIHLKWWIKGMDPSFAAENYSIMISTTGGTTAADISNYTTLLTGTTTGSWVQKDINLSSYAGQTIYIAFRHHNVTDMFYLVIDDVEVTATSAPTQYTITANSNNSAWGTVTGGGTYDSGVTATLTATANSGYHFVQWQDGDQQNPRTITVTGNATYTATFAEDETPGCPAVTSYPYSESFDEGIGCWTAIDANNDGYTWLTSAGINGSNSSVMPHSGNAMMASFSWNGEALQANEYLVSPQFTLPAGQTITLSWWFRVNGSFPEDNLAVRVSTTGNAVSNFSTTLIDIMPTADNGSWTQQTLDLSAYAGQSIYLAFHHHDSYDMNYLLVDDVQITATAAAPTQYTITANSNNSAWGTVTGGGTYNSGATATLTATANSGYHFVQWQDGDQQNPRTVTVTANATYTATFAEDEAPQPGDDCIITTFPWSEDFDGDLSVLSCWSTYDFDANDTTWGFTLNYGYNGSICAYVMYQLQASDGLASPAIATPGTYTVSWKVRAMHPTYPESYEVWVLGSNSEMIFSETLSDTLYQDRTATFTVAAGDTVRIMWYYVSADMFALFLDNFAISQGGSTPPTPTQYTITANSNNSAWGTVTGGGTYDSGATATLTATANSGYHFVQWQDGDQQNPRTITVTGNATYTATFAEDETPQPTDTCTITTFPYTENFEDVNTLGCWRLLDNDGDGYGWVYFGGTDSLYGHNSNYCLGSASWYNVALTPDNWLFMPAMQLPAGQQIHLKWWIKGMDPSFAAENYSVMISTTGGMTAADISNYTTLLTGTTTGSWAQKDINLSSYAGQTVYIAFRHHNVTDMFYLVIDDVEVTATSAPTQYTITANSNNTAWGTVTGGGTYNSGATATLTATPTSGYRFVSWQDGNTQNPRTITVTGNATYTATFEAIQYTITANSNNTAWGTVTGGGTYNSGATATLTATPTNGYRFVSWQDGNTQNPRTITVTGNATYTATFEAIQYTITANSNNTAWGTVTGGGTYNSGATATLTATPTNGYRFVSWQDGNTQNPRSITVTGNATYTATFEAIPPTQYTITVLSNNDAWGTVSGGGTYNEGATATLTATPTNGYQFVGWNDGNTDNPRTVTVTGPATYIATFEAMPVQYTITVLSNNDTWGTVSGGGTYNEGATATLTATPANGYHFVSWNDGNTDNPRTITVTASTTYIATFEVAVGIDGVETAAVAIVPNPATEYATLQGLKAGIEVTLVDINGKIRYSGTAQSDMMTLDVSGLAAGVYFVRVSDGTETAVRKLIVK